MRYFILLMLFSIPAFSEEIHFECKYYTSFDSWENVGIENSDGKRQILDAYGGKRTDAGRKHKIIFDAKKLTVTLYDSVASCKISDDQDTYVCERNSYVDGEFGGNYYSRHRINRRSLEYQYYSSITDKLSGEKDSFIAYEGKCERQQDIQF